MSEEARDLEKDLWSAMIASCTCHAKSPETKWHDKTCTYALHADSLGEIQRLKALINSPITSDFIEGVKVEIPHQEYRWGAEHDAGKQANDWFWLIGFLAGKALRAAMSDDTDKAKHHIITTAATLGNWFKSLEGSSSMRPGIESIPLGGEENG